MKNRRHGFTLIELLIAMTIFAVLAVMSYRALDSLLKTREHLDLQSSRLRDVALLFARLENDFAAVLARRVRNADNVTEDALRLSPLLPGANDATIVFTRSGFAGATGSAGGPQRIGYRLHNGALQLLIWPSLDMPPRGVPDAHEALGNVREVTWRAMDRTGNFVLDWRSTGAEGLSYFPSALELTVTLQSGEQYTRLFTLAGGR